MADDPLLTDPIPFSDDFTLFDDDDTFDITFDDLNLPSDTEDFLNSTVHPSNLLDPSFNDTTVFHDFVSNNCCSVNCSVNCNGNCNGGTDVSGFLNIPSPDEGFDDVSITSARVLDQNHPVSSQGSGNSINNSNNNNNNNNNSVNSINNNNNSVNSMNCVSSPESGNSVVEQKVKREMVRNEDMVLKRKNESSDVNSESRTVKYRRSNEASGATEDLDEKDEKKKARLIRNRESAQLSRQRKKHYVEELEDKVRAMHATIQDLNARISYFAAENATLKQQMVGNGAGVGVGAPPVMYPAHPAMGPMGYPWMPCPPYVVKSQGSQVPLVPIPRLKPQQHMACKEKSKKVDVKKAKTKKVAGISFVGLLLFMLLFGGLVPIMNVKLGGGVINGGGYSGKGSDFKNNKMYNNHGRVLMGDEYMNGTNGKIRNASEPLVASLYVPRNDKLVKIDGNLIIHSVLASEKAMASREEEGMGKMDDVGLAVSQDLVPAIPAVSRNGGRQPHVYRSSSDRQRALASDKENVKSKHADGKLQQWFREGLAGPMLSSGMCTEVFQFDVSAAIVPATSVVNITATENHHNSTYINTMKNRRILHGLPIPLSTTTTNITKEQVASATKSGSHDSNHNEPHHKNNSVSPMVVSVLFDPREAGDGGDVDSGMMGGGGAGGAKGKSFSRIFVVVLLDSVKYVTYSCMLPLKGASHLVTA
ncbi:hypothetical protein M8C21_032947 [Ambrosia artemisiifolia]|uniref:BZIP domain-containing protein n=1 Tax=Ambrosia artemisiifolia TaxID=4212 RepID=A0AAD5BQA4_AMBAR|nr:hypothetical protein M8C21_032947 [Ambrosia artemisiifolia]